MRKRNLQSLCLQGVIVIILSVCIFLNANADDIKMQVIQNVISDDQLAMRFQAQEVFSEKVIKFLDRGFTIRIEYRIELWQSRKYWFDRLSSQYNLIYQMKFEPLEKRYECLRKQQGEAADSKLDPKREKITEWATKIDKLLNIAPISQLDPDAAFYYDIEIIIATLTSENIKDLQKWLGEFSAEEEKPSTLTKTTFKVAADFISSRNSKKSSMRSEKFHLQNLPKIEKKNP